MMLPQGPLIGLTFAVTSAADLPPLQGDWIEPLRAENGQDVGMLVVPLGSREPRPFVVAVHGAAGRPDWMCGATRDTLGLHPFIVCPHPDAQLQTMASWSDAAQVRRAVERAVEAATRKYGERIRQDAPLYVGHSQGAMLAPAFFSLPGKTHFSHVLFYEGLPSSPALARKALASAGPARVLLVSGQRGWERGHAAFARDLERVGITARHRHVESGHFFGPKSIALMRTQLAWLLGDARGWESAHFTPSP